MNISSKRPKGFTYQVAAFYSFDEMNDEKISFLSNQFDLFASKYEIMGTIILASEGINGTLCSSEEGVQQIINLLSKVLNNQNLEFKISWTDKQAFRRFKVRKKKEIVTMGIPGVNPLEKVGTYIEPSLWNDLLRDPDTLVIDTRNNYEIRIGSFEGAINPNTRTFREFPDWVQKNLKNLSDQKKTKTIAMFCTGGIRCEKATSYLKKEGFEKVVHLKGGILKYLEEVEEKDSLWEGECFVFDQRVALNQQLIQGDHLLCHACGMPLSSEERKKLSYIRGVQCEYCENLFSDQDRVRFAERQRQYDEKI